MSYVRDHCKTRHCVLNGREHLNRGDNKTSSPGHSITNHCFSRHYIMLALAGLLVAMLLPTYVDQLLSLSVDYAFPDINMREILESFSVKRYFLGSPMALSTMMEMRCGPVCYYTKRVPDLYDLQPGDHIRHVGSLYAHHSLVDRVLNESAVLVVHFNDDRPNARKVSGCFPYFDKAIVLEQTLLLNTSVDIVELVIYDSEHQIEPNKARLKVARSRLGSTDYGLLTNNCEAFMHELCVGLRYSRQAEFIADFMQIVLFVPYLALIHLCHRLFGEKPSRTKKINTYVPEMDEGPVIQELKKVPNGEDVFDEICSSNHLHGLFINNAYITALLIFLYVWYRTCVWILTKFGVFFYRMSFPDYY